ncbi:MAG: type II toxin-antitoxin system RelE/ParE family toxin [Flavobacteriales bacterium]
MARKVVWTAPAEKDRKSILSYWIERNGSTTYSLKLFERFRAATKTILSHPYIGRPTNIEGVRVLAVGDYLLFYEVFADSIVVHHIWDGRRNLEDLKF